MADKERKLARSFEEADKLASNKISKEEAIQVIKECFGVPPEKLLTDDQCLVANYVLGFNNIWAKKQPDGTYIGFLDGTWRWFAGFCASLCEEERNYLDYYCSKPPKENHDLIAQFEGALKQKGWECLYRE